MRFKLNFLALLLIVVFFSCDNEPYEGLLVFDTQLSCLEATNQVENASANLLNSSIDTYEDNCLAYQKALEDQLKSCSEENQISNPLNFTGNCESDSFFKVDFDAATYLASSAQAHLGGGTLTITAERDNETFEIVLNHTTEGTYQFGLTDSNGDANLATYSIGINESDNWMSITDGNIIQGEITVTEIDFYNAKISGKFNFIGRNENETKLFTNGIFINIPLTKDNEFFALVDGEEFVDFTFIPYHNDIAGVAGFVMLTEDGNAVMDFTIDQKATPPGVYSLRRIPDYPRAGYTGNPDFYYHANGTLTISEHNPNTGFLMGTFDFVGEFEGATPESYTITEGSFCISYFQE